MLLVVIAFLGGYLMFCGMASLAVSSALWMTAEHQMSMENLTTGAGLPELWVGRMEHGLENSTVDQLEKLARALKVETATFFVQPSNKRAALEAKPLSEADPPVPTARRDGRG